MFSTKLFQRDEPIVMKKPQKGLQAKCPAGNNCVGGQGMKSTRAFWLKKMRESSQIRPVSGHGHSCCNLEGFKTEIR